MGCDSSLHNNGTRLTSLSEYSEPSTIALLTLQSVHRQQGFAYGFHVVRRRQVNGVSVGILVELGGDYRDDLNRS